ncbi:hypothetical protein HZS61_001732 [Fusarium oxysporum f. sp. conglutinans]|uniref:Protein kinase domain-containing protein n=2 Tax=Fusarium oxysporum f. sp. conglutinans TaxID=100902 RepID=A0A8H6LTL4_FUSOX|nr:hypothetical protein HZS61_001732 [Fusarium oxysporum f. sp. conglutinans]
MKALRRNTQLAESDVRGKKTGFSLKYWLGLKSGLVSCFRAGGQKRTAPPPILPVAAEKDMVPPANQADDFSKQLYSLMVLGTFSFEEVQHLHHLGEQLESFRVVLQLDRQTLRDVTEHYQDLASRNGFTAKMIKGCKGDVVSFTRRVDRIRKNLEIRLTQIESMMAWLQEGKTLFDGILQYRSVQVSHVFTESSHIQSEKMERIAHKTEQETISMHVVTCVTLAFLPGTFVAAFFQSGLVEINKASDGFLVAERQLPSEAYIWGIFRINILRSLCPLIFNLDATGHSMSQLTISSYPMDQLVDHFRAEVERVSVSGVNGEDKVVSYVPLSALKRYWTVKRVNNILNCPTNPISENPRVIIESHLQIFSTLVYKGFCDRISWFFRSNPKNLDDHNLPFDAQVFDRTYDWSNSFLEHQWMFCPAEFADRRYHKRIFDSKVILPVTHLSDIRPKRRGPDGAILRKYQLNSHSNSIVPNNKTIVFKIYEGHEGEDRYNAETDVYVMLDKLSNDCIAKDIASFCFRGTHKFIIVLEYAEGGSLTDYLQRSLTPVTPEETTLLWEQLFNLIDALYLLSSIYQQTPMQQQTLVGMYGKDLLKPQSLSKKADDRIIVAPEVFSNFSIQDSCDVGISPIADIWSLGALFSDILVWTIAGEQGREEYCLRRSTEISQYRHLRAANHDCCFHDGEQRLNSIEDVHNEVMKHKRSSDSISPLISDLILDHMLVGPRERLDAMQIRTYAARKFKENQKGNAAAKLPSDGIFSTPTPVNPNRDPVKPPNRQTPERRATMPPNGFKGHSLPEGTSMPYPPTAEPSHIGGTNMNQQNHQQNGNIISEERVVTVKQVYPMIVEKNSRFSLGRLFGADPSKSDEIMELHGMQEARSKISENNGRDQILLFDNFESMQTHKRKAMKTARVISYVAKEADDDGMEVYAASKTAKGPIKCKNSTEVEAAIGKFKTVKGKCKLRKCLDDILNRVLKKDGFKPTSIYILTDGVWEPGDDQVKFAIIRAINFLIEHRLPSSALMFQFVQFGNDQKGEARMRRLDDEYKKETEDEDYMETGMLSITAPAYTSPSGYELSTVPKPTITEDNDVLIKVHAASINPVDVKKAAGVFKMAIKEEFPYKIGYDASGVVVEVGKGVKGLKVGDEVYTRLPEVGRGAWSEFAKCPDRYVSLKPKVLSFADAASLPLAGVTALQVLGQYRGSLEGKTVFIPGGLSGTGAIACQLAKNVFHAGKVITTVSTSKIPKVPELLGEGTVDQIIDYTKQKISEAIPPKSVDFCFDTTGQSMEFLSRMVPSTSMIVSISTTPSASTLQTSSVMRRPDNPRIPFAGRVFLDAADAVRRLRAWRWGVTYMYHFLDPNLEDLDTLTGYVENGKVKPVVGARIDMRDIKAVREACDQTYKGKGGLGKTVFEVIQD